MKPLFLLPFLALASCALSDTPDSKFTKTTTPAQEVAGVPLARIWEQLVKEARKDAGVGFSSSHTGSFGGVHTMVHDRLNFLDTKRAGDPAEAFHNACARRFSKWATENGAEMSTTGSSENCLRIKAKNGDYLSTMYLRPSAGESRGDVVIVFVDAEGFDRTGYNAQRVPTTAEQGVPPNGP